MRKITFFLFMVLMFSIANASLVVSIDKYEPYPAEPGKYVTVWVRVENRGQDAINDVTVELVPKFPFSLDPNENATRIIGSLGPGASVIKDYKVRVDEKAIEGENDFEIKYKYNGYEWVTIVEKINVQTHDAVLAIVKTESDEISPGSEGTVKIKLKNMADSFLKDISIKLDLTDIPVSPVDTGSEKRIYLIESGEEKEVSFKLVALPDAEGGIYKIPITITYSDLVGNDYTKTDILTVKIGGAPNIIIVPSEESTLVAGKAQKISLDVINAGLTKVKFLRLKLNVSEDFDVLLPNEYYVGDVDSDDFETAEFTIVPKITGELTMPIEVTYMDVNNEEHSEVKDVTIKVYTVSELKALGLIESNVGTWIVLLLVFGVAIFYFLKRIKK